LDPDDKIQECSKVIEQGANEDALRGLGLCYRNSGCAEWNSALARLYSSRGDGHLAKQDLQQARADYDKSLAINEINADTFLQSDAACDALLGRGRAYAGQGVYDRAIADYDKALRTKSNSLGYSLCSNKSELNKFRDAAIAQKDAGERSPPPQVPIANATQSPVTPAPSASLTSEQRKSGEDMGKHLQKSFDEIAKTINQALVASEPAKPVTTTANPAPPPGIMQAAVEPDKPVVETPVTVLVAPSEAGGKRLALVIGNSDYRSIGKLDNPANDAKLMADVLKQVGFELVGGGPRLDLDKAGLDQAVLDFGNRLQGAEVGLFYYAGHGVQVRGHNYLVPVNANPVKETDADFQMLDADLVLRQMEGAGTRLNLVMLDACRNNPLATRGFRAASGGLAQMEAPEGTLISFATAPGKLALDGSEGNSPYTKALAETIRKPGLDVFQTFNQVGLAVKKSTGGSQQPWVSNSPIDGEFYFAGK
jgi:tetratricopeptide (TPR) repeat protein